MSPTHKTVLLLSGGKDSKLALEILRAEGHQVISLCMNGKQMGEVLGAFKADPALVIHDAPWFDETTWNPFKLVCRDVRMGLVAIDYAKKFKCQAIATGLKQSDFDTKHGPWLPIMMCGFKLLLKATGLKLVYPLINADIVGDNS